MLERLGENGLETVRDRLTSQRPQCGYGLKGTCCRMCQWGPCRISAKSPRGVCGRDIELIAMANMLRAVAAGASAQTMHAHEMVMTLRAVARGDITLSVKSRERLRDVANALTVVTSQTPIEEYAGKIADALLDDLGRLTEGRMRCLGFAPKDEREKWARLGLTPRSATFEILESMHMTTLGACSDWRELFAQAVRTSLAHAYTSLVPSSTLADILFGVPEPVTAEVNYGVLEPDHVNILVHGHSAVMLEKILEKVDTDEMQAYAHDSGANGIVVAGMCCTGLEALARHGIPTVSGAMGQELVLGTGAVDEVVVDMQCVLPGMRAVAECFGTQIVTTYRSNRIPGAMHVPFDPEHPETLDADAERIVRTAIDTFASRDRSNIHIPQHTSKVTTGFTRESIMRAFGSAPKFWRRIADGEIRGVVALVGCSTPKAGFEAAHVAIATELIRNGVLVLSSGCASHALLNAGLCSTAALEIAAPGLREACETAGVPPVLTMGSCADNTRIIQTFAQLAHVEWADLCEMPFAVCGPELANEKTMGQVLAVLAHGVSVFVGATPQLPIPEGCGTSEAGTGTSEGSSGTVTKSSQVAAPDSGESAFDNGIAEFFCGGELESMFGSRLIVRSDLAESAASILAHIEEKRATLAQHLADELNAFAVPAE